MTQNETVHEQSPPAPPDGPGATASEIEMDAPHVGESPGWQPGRTWRVSAVCGFVLIGLGYLVAAWQLDAGSIDRPDIGMFPRVAGLLFVGCLVPILVREVRAEPDLSEGPDDGETSGNSWFKPVVILGAVLFYVLAATTLGHILSGATAMTVVLRLVGERRWWVQIGIAVGSSLVSYLVISVLLEMPLPIGQLGLEF